MVLDCGVWWGGGWAWVGAFVDTWLGVADMGRPTFKQGMKGRGLGAWVWWASLDLSH
ncbi:hypothetical protein Hanom_Chr05g00459531 [Helianthus anomalus]